MLNFPHATFTADALTLVVRVRWRAATRAKPLPRRAARGRPRSHQDRRHQARQPRPSSASLAGEPRRGLMRRRGLAAARSEPPPRLGRARRIPLIGYDGRGRFRPPVRVIGRTVNHCCTSLTRPLASYGYDGDVDRPRFLRAQCWNRLRHQIGRKHLRPRRAARVLAMSRPDVLPSDQMNGIGTLGWAFRGSIPCPHVPLSTLRRAPRGAPRMTRGRRGALLLRREALSSFPSCRFIPAHSFRPSTSIGSARALPRYVFEVRASMWRSTAIRVGSRHERVAQRASPPPTRATRERMSVATIMTPGPTSHMLAGRPSTHRTSSR